MLRTYKTCNSMVGFSKYELNNKLLGDVTLLIITSGITWTQPYIYKGAFFPKRIGIFPSIISKIRTN